MKPSQETQALYARFMNFKPSKGDLRKITIIEAALECISSVGVEHTTFEAIGKKLGIGRAHVAYYYPDRDKIIEAAIKFSVITAQSCIVDKVSLAKSDREKLSAFISGLFDWARLYPKHASSVLLLYYYASHAKAYRKLHHEVRKLGADRLTAIIQPLVPKENLEMAATLAKLVQTILTGHLVDYFSTQPVLSLEELRQRTVRECLYIVDSFTFSSERP